MTDAGEKQFTGEMIVLGSQYEKFPFIAAGSLVFGPLWGRASWSNIDRPNILLLHDQEDDK